MTIMRRGGCVEERRAGGAIVGLKHGGSGWERSRDGETGEQDYDDEERSNLDNGAFIIAICAPVLKNG